MNLDAYRQQLRARLDSMQMPTLDQSQVEQPQAQPPAQLAAAPRTTIDEGAPAAPAAPVSPAAAAAPTGQAPKKMGAQPDFKPEFDDLEGAKSFGDVMKAMKPASRSEYMDWWEGQYGSINTKWDALQSELGQRPDPKGKLSRKEKFQLLMEFGLELMRASQPGQDQGGGATTAAYNAVRNTQAERKGDQRDFDVKTQLIQQGRQRDLTQIGNRGQAMAAQSKMETDLTTRAKNEAIANRPQKKQTLATDQGVMDISGDKPQRMTIDGQPLTNLKVGKSGGRVPDTRPAEQKKYEHLLTLKVPPEVARRIAYRQTSGNPLKDRKDVYNAVVRANGGDTEAATAAAQEFVDTSYGPGAMDAARTPEIDQTAGPPKISTQEEYANLPAGTEYVAPDGKRRIKK
jgi:hypothetical protein